MLDFIINYYITSTQFFLVLMFLVAVFYKKTTITQFCKLVGLKEKEINIINNLGFGFEDIKFIVSILIFQFIPIFRLAFNVVYLSLTFLNKDILSARYSEKEREEFRNKIYSTKLNKDEENNSINENENEEDNDDGFFQI